MLTMMNDEAKRAEWVYGQPMAPCPACGSYNMKPQIPIAQEAVAWMTHHDEPMLYPTFAEAAAYCDDGEPPIPLYAASVAAVNQYRAMLAAMQAQANSHGAGVPDDT